MLLILDFDALPMVTGTAGGYYRCAANTPVVCILRTLVHDTVVHGCCQVSDYSRDSEVQWLITVPHHEHFRLGHLGLGFFLGGFRL